MRIGFFGLSLILGILAILTHWEGFFAGLVPAIGGIFPIADFMGNATTQAFYFAFAAWVILIVRYFR